MNVLLNILWFTAYFFIAHGLYQLVKYHIVATEIKSNSLKPLDLNLPLHRFCILAPILHEEKNIENFLENLLAQNYPKEFYDIYFISSEKEYLNNIRPNTIDILEKLKSDDRFRSLNLHHLHSPKLEGFKADQLSFAFETIYKSQPKQANHFYFLSLDTDSEVSSDTLSRFNEAIEDGIEIYQQPLVWFKNITVLHSHLMQSFGFMQTFFSLSYETPMFVGRFFSWRLKYLVGHGLCIKGSYLIKLHGFPKIIEDVRIGRLSSFLNSKIKVVKSLGNVEIAKNYGVYLKQSAIWFFGCGLFYSDFVHALSLRENKIPTIRDLVLLGYGFFKAVRWLNKGLIHLIGLVLAIILRNHALLLFFLISLLLNSTIPVLAVAKDFRKRFLDTSVSKQFSIIILSALLAPIFYLINFIGLYMGVHKLLKFYIWGQAILPKTER